MLPRTVTHRYTGEQVTFLETAAETGGEHLLIQVSLPPQGDGPPLHSHLTFTEEFEVLDGNLTVKVDKRTLNLGVGEKAFVLLGLNHTFTNTTNEPVTFTVKLTPPSLFEESMRIHYGLMDDNLTNDKGVPRNLLQLALILWMQDTLVAGLPPKFQRALLTGLVKLGKKTGAFKNLGKYTGAALNI